MNNYASLCILSYNRLEFLKDCIDTAIGETSLPMEIIVHDDGSDMIENHAAHHDYLSERLNDQSISSVILNSAGHNEGQGRALNKLATCASGDILIFSDQDLIFKSGWLEVVRAVLEENSSWKPAPAPKIGTLGGFKYSHDPVDHEKMFIRDWGDFEEHQDFVGSFMAFSREGWEKFGPFEEYSDAFAEDAVIKRKIFETDGWCNALPPEDIVENQGFGLGTSTVVVDNGGKIEVAKIHKEPLIL